MAARRLQRRDPRLLVTEGRAGPPQTLTDMIGALATLERTSHISRWMRG